MAEHASDFDVLQLLMVRETVRVQAEMLKATGWSRFYIATEMIVQAYLMAVPGLTPERAREAVLDFWKDFGKQVAAANARGQLDDGVLPFALKTDFNGEK